MPGTPGPRTGLAPINSSGEAPTILRTTTNAVIAWLEGNAAITSFGLLSAMPTSTPGSPGIAGRRYRATNAFATFRDTGTGWELESQTPQIVTTLPTPGGGIPFDGQEVLFLADATNGVVWRLRYRAASASTYKWEAVGEGAPLLAETTSGGTRSAATYGDLTGSSVGPAVTVPLAGEYAIAMSADVQNNSAGGQGSMGVQIGAAAVVADNAIQGAEDSNSVLSLSTAPFRRTVSAAATALTLRYASTVGTSTFSRRRLAVRPLRVG
jgi:hypothetical protein